ncbi:MAG: hypothetical protein H0T18_07955 [Chloroflexia bacterium]|nr:hypothetical protein [Chloroflexia bacterium]
MDDRRFDILARLVAQSGSRRGMVRGLAGVLAMLAAKHGAQPANAHHAFLGPGESCRSDSQCFAGDAPLICADNGFTMDGPLNCCTYDGYGCDVDQGCCGYSSCINGVCTSIPSDPGPGDLCVDSSPCFGADAPLTCDYVASTGDYRCCTYEGSRCGFDAACCGAATCVDGRCSSAPVYVSPGDPCQDSSQCVAADTAVTCDYVGNTNDFRCCAYEGSRCGWDGGCCGWLRCADNGFCTGLPPTGCNGQGCDCDFRDPYGCALPIWSVARCRAGSSALPGPIVGDGVMG